MGVCSPAIGRIHDHARVRQASEVRMSDTPRDQILKATRLESEERFTAAFQCMPIGAGITTLEEGRFIAVNDAFQEIFGYASEELLGRTASEFNIWSDPDNRAHVLALVKQGQPVRAFEALIRRKDGSQGWVSYSGGLVSLNGQACLLSGAVDITERKEAERALQESEERYRSLFQFTQAAMLIIDPESGSIIDANPAAEQVYGWTKAKLLQKKIEEINKTPSSQIKRDIERVQSGGHRRNEFQHRISDGSIRDVEVFTCPLSGGRPRLFSIIHDITDRKKAEGQILASEEKFFKALHTAPLVASLSRLEDGTSLDVNDQYCQVLGFTREEILGKRSADFGVLRSEERIRLLETMEATGKAHNLEFTLYAKDGRPVPCLYFGEILKVGGESLLLSMLTDISDRIMAEKSLKDALTFNQQIISSAREGVVVYGTDGRYTLWNAYMEGMTGVPAGDVIGKRPGEVFPFLEAVGIVSGIQKALRGEVVLIPAFAWSIPDKGRTGWASTSIAPLTGSAGEIIGAI